MMMGKIKNLFRKNEIDGMDVNEYVELELFEELRADYIELRKEHEKLEEGYKKLAEEHSELVDNVDILIKAIIEELNHKEDEED